MDLFQGISIFLHNEETENINGEILITKGNLRINTLNSAYKLPEEKIGFVRGKDPPE